MENQRIAMFLVFIFLASITHLDYFSENEKLEMEMEEKTVLQSSSSNSNHDVGNFSLGGYHLATDNWWQPDLFNVTITDFDGDGISNVNDSHPNNPSLPQKMAHRSVCLRTDVGCSYELTHRMIKNIQWSSQLSEVKSATWGDTNLDGYLDLVLATDDVLKIFLNDEGSLSSTPFWSTNLTENGVGYPEDLQLTDFDGDGDLDIAWAGGRATMYENTGSGFSLYHRYEYTYANDVAWCDVDNDGDMDFVVANNAGKNSLYLNDISSNPVNRFGSSPVWQSSSSHDSTSVECGDIDNDGYQDIVFTNDLDRNEIYYNNFGTIESNPSWQSQFSNRTNSLSLGDFDGDGFIDLATGDLNKYVEIYRSNSGVIPLLPTYNFDLQVPSTDDNYVTYWQNPMAMSWGDVDGDGDLDLSVANQGRSNEVYLNLNDRFVPILTNKFVDVDDTYATSWADINNDGQVELLLGRNLYSFSRGFVQEESIQVDDQVWQGIASMTSTSAGDVDNDGDLDLVIGGSTISGLLNDNGTFTNFFGTNNISSSEVEFADINNDGNLDIVDGNNVWFLEGNGATVNVGGLGNWSSSSMAPSYRFELGDIDDDGDLDMLASRDCGGMIIYENSNNNFSSSTGYSSSDLGGGCLWELALGDVDGDGDLDLAVGKRSEVIGNNLLIFRNNNGIFNVNPIWSYNIQIDVPVIKWGDLNNDGKLDLAVGSKDTRSYVFLNSGTNLAPNPHWISPNVAETTAIEWADLDTDGDLDLIISNRDQSDEIYINDNGNLSDRNNWNVGNSVSEDIVILDTNNDGLLDVFTVVSSGPNLLYLSEEDSDSDQVPDTLDEFDYNPTQAFDTDSDGHGDNLNGSTGDSCPLEGGTSWRDRLGCPDLDRDGQSDLFDRFINIDSQWSDSDGDGLGDNWANGELNSTRSNHWPGQWVENAYNPDPYPFDFDNDGFEDEAIEGAQGPFDSCPFSYGTSSTDRSGCQDSDGDGRSDRTADWTNEDGADMFPTDITQWVDSDGDGFGDNPFPANNPDSCPSEYGTSLKDGYGCLDEDDDGWGLTDDCSNSAGNSTIDQIGCPDRDGDGYSDDGDSSPDEPDIWSNIDGDAYFDQGPEETRDDCPSEAGTSFRDRLGCVDPDGDGWSSQSGNMLAHPLGDADSHPTDATQWRDRDGDGYGDNQTGNSPDSCPDLNGPSKWTVVDGQKVPQFGCADSDFDGFTDEIDTCPNVAGASEGVNWGCPDSDSDGTQDSEDSCPSLSGTSTANLKACPDSDNDGIADLEDPQPLVALIGISTPEDWDGDGVNNNDDEYPFEQTQWEDLDGDGFGDNSTGVNGDPSPSDYDNDFWLDPSDLSTTELGCLNNPEEGMDYFPEDPREWKDNDGDCIGDNSDPDDDNDGYSDVEEAQQGTDPLLSSSKPIEGFEIIVPGTEISLGAWDLIGIFGGVPLFAWIGFGIVTRNSRTARFEEDLKAANSREELEEVAKRWEFALMIKLIGPHQGIRLERMRAEYDDRFENQAFDDGPITTEDQTMLVENSVKNIPAIETSKMSTETPTRETPATSVGTDGYEWYKSESGADYYRTVGSQAEWTKFN